ncbi:hypothetical protein MNEG_2104 [Monoraphidium neglectum]|uniref:DNA-directed RNA polymerase n=1 Tax=Monoraphidium neglectum TaxID=145388 RepID=A0A0D2K672_9CHLO|nr:hypothetical protein MNEG_2104 [Monoraphidium neglectum]KIZ05863.1 hypothetical protein MNEG_2104 [Monoraphidium neglectum]|eukprot:XP_013904882.1 hypothetical protein MNEG_2104 [Monoraphidium neglectum]
MARHVAQAKGLDVPEEYERLVAPHVASFDWFLNEGLQSVVDSLDPIEIEHPATKRVHRFWFENPIVGRPVNEEASVAADSRLMPRDCREMGVTYKAPFSMDLCFESDGAGGRRRIQKRCGA